LITDIVTEHCLAFALLSVSFVDIATTHFYKW